MKVLIIGSKERYEKFLPDLPFMMEIEKVYCNRETPLEELLYLAGDANAIAVDPTLKLPVNLIESMPNLKIIQSEGVGYNGIDIEVARNHGVYVCNRKGENAPAVAEQTILLILALLRNLAKGNELVRKGQQLKLKETLMVTGIKELRDCTIGYIGFGDISKATAQRLKPFGCKQIYHTPNPKEPILEAEYDVTYASLKTLAQTSDFVVVLCPLNRDTEGMIDEEFFNWMRPYAYLINTARGEIVDNNALYNALLNGKIAGAGLDTISPIPVPADHILFTLPPEIQEHLIVSPHIGGVTTRYFVEAHRKNWENIYAVMQGHRPTNIVNNL